MTENNKLQELADMELERAQKKINYAAGLLEEAKELIQLIKDLLKHENSL